MKNKSSVIWGLVLVVIGVLLGCKALNLFDFDIFFDGWWTLFIIIPCLIGLVTDDNKTGSIIGLVIGVLLLLSAQKVIDYSYMWKLLVPIIIIIVGISIIFSNVFFKKDEEKFKKMSNKISKEGLTAVFSGQDVKLDDQVFEGTNLTAIFGGIKLDLRKAEIKEDVIINVTAVFGGVDIFLPDEVKVIIKTNSFFGGVDNKKKNNDDKKLPTVYINSSCAFGGVDIK